MDYDPLKLFGLRLVELRKRLDLSQEGLALESGLARSYLGGVERGQRNISLFNICVLASALGQEPAALLDFDHLRTRPELGAGKKAGRPKGAKTAKRSA
jgi:transcriptional regulator with XRE-family HTH domain